MTATPLQPESNSPSRRALLAGALGGIGAWAASAIGRTSPVRANDPNDVVLGSDLNFATTVTKITNQTNGNSVLFAQSNSNGVAVQGLSVSTVGVYGSSTSGWGVNGVSQSNLGVYGISGTNVGVHGFSSATDQAAILGFSNGASTAVQGVSGGSVPTAKAKTGVFGYAVQDTTATGVRGESTIGVGVRGKATTGYAGFFDGRVFTTRYYELAEIATPNAPAANQLRLFARDSGGKTQLCVRFNTGAVQVIETQP